EQLGEAQVVADRHADLGPVGECGRDDLLAGILAVGLAVDDAGDLDVEQMELAVDGLRLAVGADVDARVEAPAVLAQLDDRAGDQVDAQLPRELARPRRGRPVERLGPRGELLGRAEHVPFLRQHDERRSVRRRGADEQLGARAIARAVAGRVQLDRRGAHAVVVSKAGQIDWSVNRSASIPRPPMPPTPPSTSRIPAYRGAFGTIRPAAFDRVPLPPVRMPAWRGSRPLKRWRYVGVFGPDLMLCVGQVRVGPARQSFWAVWDRATRRLRERTLRSSGGVRLGLDRPGRVLV